MKPTPKIIVGGRPLTPQREPDPLGFMLWALFNLALGVFFGWQWMKVK